MKSPENRRGAQWTIAELKQLGKTPDSVLAKFTGRTIHEVVEMREHQRIGLPDPSRRWTAREINLLGTMSDSELGRRMRRTVHQVRKRRVSLKIPSFKPAAESRDWTLSEIKLLGTMRDDKLARQLKRTQVSVEIKRRKLGIPVFARTFRQYRLPTMRWCSSIPARRPPED